MGNILKYSAAPIVFFMFVALSMFLSIRKPFHNWDMMMYVASAVSFEERNIEKIHSFTYTQMKNTVSTSRYSKMLEGGAENYRGKIANDVNAFKEQLPLYHNRPLYTGMVFVLHKLGMKIGFATHFLSGIAVTLAFFVLYLISTAILKKPLVFIVPPAAVLLGMFELARLSTPDALACLAVLTCVYFYLKRLIMPLLILLPIMLGVRTDLILFTGLLLAAIYVFEKKHRKAVMISLIASLAVYVAIGQYWSSPGWSTIFYFNFVQTLSHPVSVPPVLTVHDYLSVLYRGIVAALPNGFLYVYVTVTFCSLYLSRTYARKATVLEVLSAPINVLTLIGFVYVVIHFILFPVLWGRFFTAPYLITALTFLSVIGQRIRDRDKTPYSYETQPRSAG